MTGWRLLLTRPAEEADALGAVLAGHGIYSSSLPLLKICPLTETPEQRARILDLDRYAAVIVISKPAARLGLELLERYWPQPPACQHWFSVGAGTGQLLAAHGLQVGWSQIGENSEALLQLPLLAEALRVQCPRVLIMRGEGGRELLADCLRAKGVTVDYLSLYRRELPVYPVGVLFSRIHEEQLNGLQVNSSESLVHLLQLAGGHWSELVGLTLFVPGARMAELARDHGATQVVECRGASATALLEALQATPAQAH